MKKKPLDVTSILATKWQNKNPHQKNVVGYFVYLSKIDPTMKQMGLAKRAVFATIDGRNLGKHLACMKTVVKWLMREITYLSTVVQDSFHEQLIDR